MASLRRKSPAAETADPVVTAAIDTDPAPVSDLRENAGPATVPASALRAQLEALRNSEELARHNANAAAVEQRRQSWVQSNPLAQEHYGDLPELHRDALASNYLDGTPGYFDYMNSRLESLRSQHPAATATRMAEEMEMRTPQEPPPPRQRTPMVSAPVSRESYGSGGYGQGSPNRIKLTPQQCEMAKLASISESEYGRQLLKLEEMKRNGDYAERR